MSMLTPDQERRDSLDRDYTPPALARRLVDLLPILPTDEVLEPHVGGGAFARALVAKVDAVVVNDLDPHAPGLCTPGIVWSHSEDFIQFRGNSAPKLPAWMSSFDPPASFQKDGARNLEQAYKAMVTIDRTLFPDGCPWPGEGCKWDWIVGNPPYKDAESHCRRALELSHNVAFLLRLGFLSSKKRIPFFKEHPPSAVFVIQGRPNFREGRINEKTGKPYGTDNSDYAFIVWGGWPNESPTLQWVAWEKD